MRRGGPLSLQLAQLRLPLMPWSVAGWPIVAEPAFYLVAVPAVLLMGLAKSGFGAGFGALATPLMAMAIPVPQAAAIMLPLLLVMDAFGLAALWREADRAVLKLLLPAGLLGTLFGTLSFGMLPTATVAGIVGALTLVFLAQRLFAKPRADAPAPPRWLGWLLGAAAGYTSFVAHAGGPPIMAYLLPLRLRPIAFTATAAVFFAAINASKWLPYAWLGLIDLRNLATSLVLMPLAPIGVWAGLHLARRMQATLFYRLVSLGMFLTGVKLLWDGWRG